MTNYPNPDDMLFWDEPPGSYGLFMKMLGDKFKGQGKFVVLPTRTIDLRQFLKE